MRKENRILLTKNPSQKKGFTLIELLIAISIIAIISAVGFSTFSQSQMRGRDARRKSDLKSIGVAMEIYRQKNSRYPCNEGTASTVAQPWIKDFLSPTYQNAICNNLGPVVDKNYISMLPVDPINTGIYYYFYRGFDCVQNGQQYYIIAVLENTNDPDRISAKNQKNCNGADMYPTYVTNANSFVIIGE